METLENNERIEQPNSDEQTFNSDADGLRKAAAALTDARERNDPGLQVEINAEEPPAAVEERFEEIDYLDRPADEPVTAHQAAKDLAAYHRAPHAPPPRRGFFPSPVRRALSGFRSI
jgi:hypothetical protein